MGSTKHIYCPDESDWERILVGHQIVDAYEKDDFAVLTLEDGTKFKVEGNEGCGGCTNGFYYVSHIAAVDNVITAVRTEVEPRTEKYDEEAYIYHVYVITGDQQVEVLTVAGDDGNGYYGTGYDLILLEE